MSEYAELYWDDNHAKLPLITGTADERAIDISKLRDETGLITLDSGYGNTGSCKSAITFIDGEKGILRYRGIPIEELAEQSTFVETAFLIIYGKLPTARRAPALLRPADKAPADSRRYEVSLRGISVQCPPDGDPFVDDQRRRLLLPGTPCDLRRPRTLTTQPP